MKGQDIGLLLKLVSLDRQGSQTQAAVEESRPEYTVITEKHSVRSMAAMTGVSKSQVNLAFQRCLENGLVSHNHKTGGFRPNRRSLFEFIVYGLRYVFPAKPGALTRGVPTSFAAPVIAQEVMTAGELFPVWPDAEAETKGLSVEPLFKSAVFAIKQDPELYALLALVDVIRIGQARERTIAAEKLREIMGLE